MRAHKLEVQIPADHQLSLDLPASLPAGPAEAGDPVAEALREIRGEHAKKIESLAAELERDLG